MSFLHAEVPLFLPYALSRAPIVREGRLLRDLTIPERDWRMYEIPAYERREYIRKKSGVQR